MSRWVRTVGNQSVSLENTQEWELRPGEPSWGIGVTVWCLQGAGITIQQGSSRTFSPTSLWYCQCLTMGTAENRSILQTKKRRCRKKNKTKKQLRKKWWESLAWVPCNVVQSSFSDEVGNTRASNRKTSIEVILLDNPWFTYLNCQYTMYEYCHH